MAYQALYRRLRPQTFDGIIGQQHIVKTLKNQIANNRINHAYLFCGTRGTGKTSTAKIFARAINCLSQGEGNDVPCNQCENCCAILEGRNVNVVEIDAASNNGVENIRDICEEVKYPPTLGRYRVYIIDEVHMLSISAFNALLKTLEEPPAHVVFILATTDPQKLPVTVLSRCQRFDFHRISLKEMTDILAKYMSEEGVDAEQDALSYVAEISDGAMRDALSILDMCMSFYYGEKITVEKVRDITGSVDRQVFFDMTDAFVQNDSAKSLDIIEKLVLDGRDILQFTGEMVMHLRNLLISRSVNGSCAALDYSQSYIDKLKEQAESLPYDYLLNLINIFSELQGNLKYSQNPRILLEVMCIRCCNPQSDSDNASLEKRIINVEEKLEKTISNGGIPQIVVAQPETVQTSAVKPVKKIEKAIPDDIKTLINSWQDFMGIIDDSVIKITLAFNTQPAYLEDGFLTIVCENPSEFDIVDKKLEKIKQYLKEFSELDFNVKPMMHDRYDRRHKELYGQADETLKEKTVEESLEVLNFDIEIK